MRAQPMFGLAKLAATPAPHLEAAFASVLRRRNDLADFTTVVKSLRSARVDGVSSGWAGGGSSRSSTSIG